jgi:hypothetical protein
MERDSFDAAIDEILATADGDVRRTCSWKQNCLTYTSAPICELPKATGGRGRGSTWL